MRFACLYSPRHRFAYLPVPKAGSSSIKWALLPLLVEDPAEAEALRAATGAGTHLHRLLRRPGIQLPKVRYERRLARGRFDGFVRFAFVRNPWDRLVSCYESKVGARRVQPVRLKLRGETGHFHKGMPFTEFARIVCDTPDEESNIHFVSQSRILCAGDDPGGALLVEHVGRFERLEQDFDSIMARIAPGMTVPLARRNVSARDGAGYRTYYDTALAERVGQRYAADVARFGYAY